MKKLLINGFIWQETGFIKRDVLLKDNKIIAIDENLPETKVKIIDCSDALILPGIIDMHVHVGEKTGGLVLADDFISLSILGDLCGIAAIGAFITETSDTHQKQKTLYNQYKAANEKAKLEFKQRIHWHLTPTVSEPQDIIPILKEGCDLKFYTTYKNAGIFRSYEEIAHWMQDLESYKPLILVHCEDDEVVRVSSSFNPFHHPFDHTKRRPEKAEIVAVEKVLDLAVQHNYPVHIVHVSTPEAALLVNQARQSAPVTCETAPHYLLLNEEYLKREDGHQWLCTPPLRSEATRGKLVELLQDGLFDAIATDHCPYITADKDRFKDTPERVPNGIAGLGATFPLLYENLVRKEKITLDELITLISSNPAKLMNLYPEYGKIRIGSNASLIILQNKTDRFTHHFAVSLSNTPDPWMDFSHNVNYRCSEVYNENHE